MDFCYFTPSHCRRFWCEVRKHQNRRTTPLKPPNLYRILVLVLPDDLAAVVDVAGPSVFRVVSQNHVCEPSVEMICVRELRRNDPLTLFVDIAPSVCAVNRLDDQCQPVGEMHGIVFRLQCKHHSSRCVDEGVTVADLHSGKSFVEGIRFVEFPLCDDFSVAADQAPFVVILCQNPCEVARPCTVANIIFRRHNPMSVNADDTPKTVRFYQSRVFVEEFRWRLELWCEKVFALRINGTP